MTYALIAPPAAEPLTLAEVKAHLRLDGDDEDGLLTGLIRTAREHLERMSGLALISQGWRLYLDRWPDGPARIGKAPVRAIDAVTVYDAAGDAVSVALDGHVLDGEAVPARLMMAQNPATARAVNGIEIDFTAGFGTAVDVPDGLKRAMLTHIAQMFACRGAVAPENQPAVIPDGYERLVAPWLPRRL
ncbi:head-tail connector protein [Rhizobium sp. YJ-22]|uniref:head-tail connector protein n=1 Tax=Rhizobium sp. YJ-22 TaxID=3037556 RepID=UPI0024128F43|nr:head-tail connector protein [Rhizobium sp. YJ-22]MDG3574854.1 head-tail connector protein [Rhizobium sp. YJ-22]